MRWALPCAFLASACAVVAGLDQDYSPSGGGSPPDAGPSDDGALGDSARPSDAGGSADSGVPSFCDYTEYFAFDVTLAGSSGTSPAGVTDPVAYDPGKYGKCAQLGHSGQLPTSLQYAEPLREDQGTVSMWFKPDTWGACSAPHTLFGTKGAGPTSLCVQGQGILSNAPPGAAAIPSSPTFVDGNWNHLVVTYSVVSLPLQELLNGRLTLGAGAYSPKGSFGITLGDDTAPPDACYDEVAIWQRALSTDEMQALYALRMPLKAACLR